MGKRIAKSTEIIGERFHRARHVFHVVGLTRAQAHQGLELVFLAQVFTFQLHRRHHVPVALCDVDGDGHIVLARRNGYLGGIDPEFQKTAGEVIRAQVFQVGVELGTRVAVGLGVPAQPATGIQVKQATQRGLWKRLTAHNPYVLDLGHVAFDHIEVEVDAVALTRRHGGDHLRGVHAAVDVLPLELLLCAVGQCLVKWAPFGQADVAQRFLQHLGIKLFDAGETHVGHGRALFDDHHQHVAVDLQSHVAEQTEAEERADRRGTLVVVVLLTNAKRQRSEHGARLHALQSLHADVAQRERLNGPSGQGRQQRSRER